MTDTTESISCLIDCAAAVTDYSEERYNVATFTSGTAHYSTRPLAFSRPSKGVSVIDLPCPVCGKQVTVTVWSRGRVMWHRAKTGVLALASVPFIIIGVGVFALMFALGWMLAKPFRRGLFYGTDTSFPDSTRERDLLRVKHRIR